MRNALAFVLSVSLVACEAASVEREHQYTLAADELDGPAAEVASLEIDSAFSDEEHETISSAVAKWAEVVLDRRSLDGWRVVRGVPSDDLMGYADYDRKIVWLRAPLPRDVLFVLALHELGHAHGIHEHVEHGVMQEYIAWPLLSDFTLDDMTECRRVGICASYDVAALRPAR